jgi:hypothetical protein
MLPTAIRFWEKQGLGPRSGTKDVVAFALFEGSDDKRALVAAWMQRVGRAYNVRTVCFQATDLADGITGSWLRYPHRWQCRVI